MRRIAATLAVVITLPFSAGSVWADMGADPAQRGNYADGVEAYNRGDYATALQEFRPLAEQGDAKAQFNLGFMYDNGKGVPENDAKAAKWHRKAAEQDDVMAQYSLGGMYFRGEGVSQNYTEAVKWFRKAAEQGDAYAQVNLGFMYGTGEGVPMNYVKAYMWYSLAKAQGNVDAAKGLYIIEKEMNTDQIAKAQVLATEWKEKHN